MMKRVIACIRYLRRVVSIVLCLMVISLQLPLDTAWDWRSGQAWADADSNIDPSAKYAWGTNVGWINFNPAHGGVVVYTDHLEGYARGMF